MLIHMLIHIVIHILIHILIRIPMHAGKTAVAYIQEEETKKMLIGKNPIEQPAEDVDVDVFRASINDSV